LAEKGITLIVRQLNGLEILTYNSGSLKIRGRLANTGDVVVMVLMVAIVMFVVVAHLVMQLAVAIGE